MSVGSVVLLVLAVGLLVAVVALVRAESALPWPAIVVAAVTSAICFTVGGGSVRETSAPSVATVAGFVAGFLSVLSAVLALVPTRRHDRPATRLPLILGAGGTALGAIGLLVTALAR